MERYEEVYDRIWSKCELDGAKNVLTAKWQFIATVGLHAVLPCVLDHFWYVCSKEGKMAPTISGRWICPAAGTAALFALHTGFKDCEDIIKTMPNLEEGEFDKLKKELEKEVAKVNTNRWHSSVNATLYG